jgi:hypothetical protein
MDIQHTGLKQSMRADIMRQNNVCERKPALNPDTDAEEDPALASGYQQTPYMGTSPIRKRPPLGPYRRPMPRALR